MTLKTIKELAIFMHDTYEELSKDMGWQTQETCKVEFDNLPNRNKCVMLGVAGKVLEDFKKDVKEVIDEECGNFKHACRLKARINGK